MLRRPDFARSAKGAFTAPRSVRLWFPIAILPLSLLGIFLGSLLAGTGCRKTIADPPGPTTARAPIAQPAPAWLEDVTEKIGLNFVHDVGPVGTYFMPEIQGSGAAIFDFDNDGRMD